MPTKLRRKPDLTIDAVQFNGKNSSELVNFAQSAVDFDNAGGLCFGRNLNTARFVVGDWIVKDVEGFFYVLADSLKQKLYDEV